MILLRHFFMLLTFMYRYQVRTIFWHNRRSVAVPHVSNRMKPSNLQKRDKPYSVLGCVGVREKPWSPKIREKSPCPTVLQLEWVISTRWDENMTLFVFSACYEIHWNSFCGRKQTKNAKIRKGEFLFAKGALIGKSIFQTQPINAVHGRCSSSGVLGDIPSNFTRSVRRRIVL